MARKRNTLQPLSREDVASEVVSVLQSNPEATDAEICDSLNRWLTRRNSTLSVTPNDIAAHRLELQIPPSERRPFQKDLFG